MQMDMHLVEPLSIYLKLAYKIVLFYLEYASILQSGINRRSQYFLSLTEKYQHKNISCLLCSTDRPVFVVKCQILLLSIGFTTK